jgi:hypothetical protein
VSALGEKSLDKLADMVLNVLWQDQLELWAAVEAKMGSVGPGAVKKAFDDAVSRFLMGPLRDQLDVRWGMSFCMHCNDDNIEKNGIAFVAPNGDGLEFNQCLNCRVGLIYDVKAAKAKLSIYTIGLGKKEQFDGVSFYWDAIVPEELKPFRPTYELVKGGQWLGTLSIGNDWTLSFLPFEAMLHGRSWRERELWMRQIPQHLTGAISQFMEAAKQQIRAAMAIGSRIGST